jgi:hypothetical protein
LAVGDVHRLESTRPMLVINKLTFNHHLSAPFVMCAVVHGIAFAVREFWIVPLGTRSPSDTARERQRGKNGFTFCNHGRPLGAFVTHCRH